MVTFLLHDSIFLRGVGATCFIDNSLVFIKFFHVKFEPIIKTNDFNFLEKSSFNVSMK